MSKLDDILEQHDCASCDGFNCGGIANVAEHRFDDYQAVEHVKGLILELIEEVAKETSISRTTSGVTLQMVRLTEKVKGL